MQEICRFLDLYLSIVSRFYCKANQYLKILLLFKRLKMIKNGSVMDPQIGVDPLFSYLCKQV